MTDSTAQHMAARDDTDLLARLIAAAEQAHIPEAAAFIRISVGNIISTDIGNGSTITSVYSYSAAARADAVAALPLKPGLDPAAVTDTQLSQAIQAVWAPPASA